MTIAPLNGARLEQVLDDTYPTWGEGLSRQAYGRWNHAQMATAWGRQHLRRVGLFEGDDLLCSAKHYEFVARARGQAVRVLGIGAVFTPPARRGQGYARALIEAMIAEAAALGPGLALLFSEIGPDYYARLGFHALPQRVVTLEVVRGAGVPAMLVRSGDDRDLPAIAEMSSRYREGAAFALDRPPELIAFALARKRLRAGLGPPGLRDVAFLVAEEAHRPAAYVVVTRGPEGRMIEECGDRDPSGARVGAILQTMAAREPEDAGAPLRAWLPDSLRPPQVRVAATAPADEIMMVRPLGESPSILQEAGQTIYWHADVF